MGNIKSNNMAKSLDILINHRVFFNPLRICLVILVLSSSACVPVADNVDAPAGNNFTDHKEVWPKAPADPKVAFKMSFSHPVDLGIKQSAFQQFKTFFAGESNQGMVKPMAIVVTEEGVVYVADPGAAGVHQYDVKKSKYQLIQLAENEPLLSPVGLAIGPDNSVYVADSYLDRIYKIGKRAKTAVPISTDEPLIQPTGLAIDSINGNIYVADTAVHEIKVFTEQGRLINQFGSHGMGPGEFNFPTMIQRDKQGNLLVVDSMNFRIQVLDDKGSYLHEFGKNGDGYGDLSRPKSIAADSAGHLYITESLFHAFQIYDDKGNFLLAIGEQGHNPGQFWLPTGIFISDSDDIYVCDSFNKRIQVFQYVGSGL